MARWRFRLGCSLPVSLLSLRVPAGVEPVCGFPSAVAPLYFMGRLQRFLPPRMHPLGPPASSLLPWGWPDLNWRSPTYEDGEDDLAPLHPYWHRAAPPISAFT